MIRTTLICILIIFSVSISGEIPAFWDKSNDRIEFQLPYHEGDLYLCELKDKYRFQANPPLSDRCFRWPTSDINEFLSALAETAERSEVIYAFFNTDLKRQEIIVHIGNSKYKLFQLVYQKEVRRYYLEVWDEKNRYFFFQIDPAKAR